MSTDVEELSPFLARQRKYDPTPEQRAVMDRTKTLPDVLRAKDGTFFAKGTTAELRNRVAPFRTRILSR